MNNQPPRATRTTNEAPTISGGPVVAADLDAWKAAVDEQERLCASMRFGAAVVSIALTTPSVEQRRSALAVLAAEMTSTDVIGILSDTEFALVLMPLESVLVGQQRVRRIDDALRATGIVAAIGWAMRQDGHGLFHASARADAALASARRQRGLDLR
ncbi:MAG TPA: hypothetical protein VM282_15290 [Acidimicrobiales bacterium]|nr:hypothetical protein [Acidimicrobiales bacterium]